MIWDNFFTSGGLGMYPISIDGFLLLASALLLALRPERRFVPLVVCLARADLLSRMGVPGGAKPLSQSRALASACGGAWC